MTNPAFWAMLDELIENSEIVVDRPEGSAAYPMDYGRLSGAHSMDGAGIGVWRGSSPVGALAGICVTADLFKRDSEVRLLVGVSDGEIDGIADFYRIQDKLEGLVILRGAGTQPNSAFWAALDTLMSTSALVIDRPAGTRHPRYESLVYGVDYGYLANTRSMDGGGIDVWRGTNPDAGLDHMMVTVDMVKGDSEIKLLIGVTEREIDYIRHFHNDSARMKGLLISRA